VSTLVAGLRSAAGHPSGPQTAADPDTAIDTSLATSSGHQPYQGQSFRKQRTVNPPIAPTRYNFLYSSSRPALRAAAFGGRPRPATPTFRSRASSGLPKGQPVRARLNG
jgi:hypothetical protein